MSFSVPRTWVDGELENATILNAHIRDQFLAMGPHLIVRKPSDESVSASTAQQADDHLILPLAANEAWQFRFELAVVSTAAADISLSLDAPASATLYCCIVWADATGSFSFVDFSSTSFPTASKTFFVPTSLIGIPLSGTIVNGTNAGNFTLRWAQATASGTTTMKANSMLWGVKLA